MPIYKMYIYMLIYKKLLPPKAWTYCKINPSNTYFMLNTQR